MEYGIWNADCAKRNGWKSDFQFFRIPHSNFRIPRCLTPETWNHCQRRDGCLCPKRASDLCWFNYGFIATDYFLDVSIRTENGFRILPGWPWAMRPEVFFFDYGNHIIYQKVKLNIAIITAALELYSVCTVADVGYEPFYFTCHVVFVLVCCSCRPRPFSCSCCYLLMPHLGHHYLIR